MVRRKLDRNIKNIPLVLERFAGNPIITPNLNNWWETKATFNPAAVYEGGKVHILYRAIGETDVSMLGYASSSDGLHIEERLGKPVYTPREPFEGVNPVYQPSDKKTGLYVSGGGGMGGCEDPRLSKIDDRIYMTYVAYDGWSPPRVALSSIDVHDFLNKKWNWEKPVLISAPNVVDKNACILPEKIEGKYVIFHRVYPNILIDVVDDLDFDGQTRWLQGQYEIPVRALSSDWDSHKVGAGPPPLKTKDGWLLIYQAVGRCDGYNYKIGAMLLDAKDPTKVIARSKKPILEPKAWYENEGWKAGVVYPCGAAIIGKHLFVYYGGADKIVGVASVKLNGFLEELSNNHKEHAAQTTPSLATAETEEMPKSVKGFCLKCGKNRTLKNARRLVINKRHVIKGICSRCGRNIVKFVKQTRAPAKKAKRVKKG